MKKYQRDAIIGIERENERDENYRSKSNPQIDRERTPRNYHFIKPDDTYTTFINQRIIQTDLHNDVGKHWNLERGKEGSTAEHLDTVEFKLKKMKEAADRAERQADEAESRQAVAKKGADAAESRKAHAEEATRALEEKRGKLEREVEPLQVAAEVLQEYSDGKRKLNKRDLPVIAAEAAKLKAENGQLEQQLEVSRRDQSDVFTLYKKTEREKQALQSDADTLRALREHAPDKLKEALAAAEQRKATKHSSPFKGSENKWSK